MARRCDREVYRADVGARHETVAPDGRTAVLVRYGKRVVRFTPTTAQRGKIAHGTGTIRIFSNQIVERFPYR